MIRQRLYRVIPGRRFFSGGDNKWWDDSASSKSIFDEVPVDDSAPPTESTDIFKRNPSALFTTKLTKRIPVVEGTPKLTLSEALFLAKEAGVFTTREIQTHVIKSPSFSDNDSPFLLEDFFTSEDGQTGNAKVDQTTTPTTTVSLDTSTSDPTLDTVPEAIHSALSQFSSRRSPTFTDRFGREWKILAEGKGTRKRATAHVIVTKGTGVVKVNGEEDFTKRWPVYSNRFDVLDPFLKTTSAGMFDVWIAVKGGGTSGQAGAARLAVGRALVDARPECEDELKDTLVLFEDTRQKTSKFPGKRGAYARSNWTLR
jgi:small subunit ribosomal protein S9